MIKIGSDEFLHNHTTDHATSPASLSAIRTGIGIGPGVVFYLSGGSSASFYAENLVDEELVEILKLFPKKAQDPKESTD